MCYTLTLQCRVKMHETSCCYDHARHPGDVNWWTRIEFKNRDTVRYFSCYTSASRIAINTRFHEPQSCTLHPTSHRAYEFNPNDRPGNRVCGFVFSFRTRRGNVREDDFREHLTVSLVVLRLWRQEQQSNGKRRRQQKGLSNCVKLFIESLQERTPRKHGN